MAQWLTEVKGTFNIGRNEAKRKKRAEEAQRRAAGLGTPNQERQHKLALARRFGQGVCE